MSVEFRSAAPVRQDGTARYPERLRRVGCLEPVYGEVLDFLIGEAQLLDSGRLEEWLRLLTPGVFYWMPVRSTVAREAGAGFDAAMGFLFETLDSLRLRVLRSVKSASAYAEDPESRTRRFVGNLLLHTTGEPHEYAADTNILLLRNRGDEAGFEQIPARREDLLLRTGDGWRLAQRIVLLDQMVLGTSNVAIFL
jgi:3-phenylpropionate/cinnamic acid dioxygenase small subunit